MEDLILKAQEREVLGKANLNKLRSLGTIPAILYGDKGKNKALQIIYSDLNRLMHGHHIENAVIKLELTKKDAKEKSKPIPVMIKEIQYHPVSDKIIHIDFCHISLTKAIKVKVPVTATGDAIGVKQDGGTLDHIMWEVEIESLPVNIPETISVDVTDLKIGDSIFVRDLKVSSDIKILSDMDAVVLSVSPPVKEEVAAPEEELAPGSAPQEPEVIKEKKPKPEETAAPEGALKKEEKK